MPWEAPGPGSGTQVDPSVLSFYARRIKTAMTRNDGERLWIRIPPKHSPERAPCWKREKERSKHRNDHTASVSRVFNQFTNG